jgi:hypothetical protein
MEVFTMIKIDMWNGEKAQNADKIDIFFYDLDCEYRGNIYRAKECIGDYTADTAQEIEKAFPQLVFNWN